MQSAVTRPRSAERAFTLIELLVVMVIVAILAVVVIPRVINRTEDARLSRALADVHSVDSALQTYKLDTGSYPTQDQGLQVLLTNVANAPKWNGPYLQNGLPKDPWGHDYIYKIPPEHGTDYDVFSAGPDGQPGTADDIGQWSQ